MRIKELSAEAILFSVNENCAKSIESSIIERIIRKSIQLRLYLISKSFYIL